MSALVVVRRERKKTPTAECCVVGPHAEAVAGRSPVPVEKTGASSRGWKPPLSNEIRGLFREFGEV